MVHFEIVGGIFGAKLGCTSVQHSKCGKWPGRSCNRTGEVISKISLPKVNCHEA